MLLSTKAGLGPGHVVLDGDPAPSKWAQQPHFSAHVYCGETVEWMSVVAKTAGWIRIPLGTEVGPCPGDIVLDGDPAPPQIRKGHSCPLFVPSIVAKRSPIAATAELLYIIGRIYYSDQHGHSIFSEQPAVTDSHHCKPTSC